jgi:hypothetical protein
MGLFYPVFQSNNNNTNINYILQIVNPNFILKGLHQVVVVQTLKRIMKKIRPNFQMK